MIENNTSKMILGFTAAILLGLGGVVLSVAIGSIGFIASIASAITAWGVVAGYEKVSGLVISSSSAKVLVGIIVTLVLIALCFNVIFYRYQTFDIIIYTVLSALGVMSTIQSLMKE
jgi:hypothetical protein